MGKNKLARWNELGSFSKVFQPAIDTITTKDHPVKGTWKSKVFGNDNPIITELGCGKGEYTVGLANRFPMKNFIGVDIKGARMWRGAKTANDEDIQNVAFLRTRIEFINSFFTGDEVDEIWITFPDPHPGGRNSGKRLTSPCFLNKYRLMLRDNGIIHLKTDNRELHDYTLKVISHNGLELLTSTSDLYGENRNDDILSIRTHYEKMFLKAGMKINYLAFRLDRNKYIEDAPYKTQQA